MTYFSGNDTSVVAYDCTSMPNCTFSQLNVFDVGVTSGTQARATLEDPEGMPVRPWLTALWSASFAEQEFASRQGLTSYVAVDSSSTTFTSTLVNRILGGQPTVILAGDGYRGKWNVAHEYAHVVSLWDPVPTLAFADVDYDLNGVGHFFGSVEYQSAAAAEGVAYFYSSAVWTDVGTDTAVSLPYGLIVGSPPTVTAQTIGSVSLCPGCGAGTANTRDWASAFLDFAQDAELSVNYVIGMLAAAHPWTTPADTTADFWNDFDTAMSTYLTMGEKAIWDTVAADKGIDQ